MRLGEGVEWSIHCCTILALLPQGVTISGRRLAEFHAVPAPYLVKHLQKLSQAGIVETTTGRKGGYRLARDQSEITLLDVVLALEGGGASVSMYGNPARWAIGDQGPYVSSPVRDISSDVAC